MTKDILFIPIACVVAFGAAGLLISVLRSMKQGQWHTRHMHSCGHHSDTHIDGWICEGCGERDGGWSTVEMRATWPWGWESR